MWLVKSVGRTVQDTYPFVGWLITRYYIRLEDLQYAKVRLHVGGKNFETILFPYNYAITAMQLYHTFQLEYKEALAVYSSIE